MSYFIYFKCTRVFRYLISLAQSKNNRLISKDVCVLFCLMFLIDVFSSIKEINRLISKGIQTFTIEKNWRSQIFSPKENLKKCASFEEPKSTTYNQGTVYFVIMLFSCLSSTNLCLRFLLTGFARKIIGFYQSSLGNDVNFTDILNISPNILAKN